VAFLDLLFKEINGFEHCNHHKKCPLGRGFIRKRTAQLFVPGAKQKANALLQRRRQLGDVRRVRRALVAHVGYMRRK